MTGADTKTIMKLLGEVGQACSDYQDEHLRDLECKKIQCDEIWSYCAMKEKNVPLEKKGQLGYGDVYTWTAICADSKLIPTWYIGKRTLDSAIPFISDLSSRVKNRIQLTTDGLDVYVEAVERAFGADVDFSQLVKTYGQEPGGEKRYSPPKYVGAKRKRITGRGNPQDVSTSFVERQNLTMRMSMRRFTRLTNGFSKKIESLAHAVALHFMYYNFVRIHQTLGVTPAMQAGVTDKLWELDDIISLLN